MPMLLRTAGRAAVLLSLLTTAVLLSLLMTAVLLSLLMTTA